MFDEEALQANVLTFIKDNADDVLQSENITKIPQACLKKIIESELVIDDVSSFCNLFILLYCETISKNQHTLRIYVLYYKKTDVHPSYEK